MMLRKHGLQGGSGAFGNAMRGSLYFGDDLPNLPSHSRPSRPTRSRRGSNAVATPPSRPSRSPKSIMSALPSSAQSTSRTEMGYQLAREFETELEQVIVHRVSQRTRELEQTIESLRERQRQLEVQAHYDALTGLANRKLLQDRFQTAVERSKRSGDSFALLMIDLDEFKAVNDTHGHLAGDQVLITVAQRLVSGARNCDTTARIGGDEFVLILESIHDVQEVARIAHKIIKALSEDIHIDDGIAVNIGASIGVALYPDDGAGLSQMLSVADLAMYECKSSGQMAL